MEISPPQKNIILHTHRSEIMLCVVQLSTKLPYKHRITRDRGHEWARDTHHAIIATRRRDYPKHSVQSQTDQVAGHDLRYLFQFCMYVGSVSSCTSLVFCVPANFIGMIHSVCCTCCDVLCVWCVYILVKEDTLMMLWMYAYLFCVNLATKKSQNFGMVIHLWLGRDQPVHIHTHLCIYMCTCIHT